MMPVGAAEARGKQKAVLAGVVYEKVGAAAVQRTAGNEYVNSCQKQQD